MNHDACVIEELIRQARVSYEEVVALQPFDKINIYITIIHTQQDCFTFFLSDIPLSVILSAGLRAPDPGSALPGLMPIPYMVTSSSYLI